MSEVLSNYLQGKLTLPPSSDKNEPYKTEI